MLIVVMCLREDRLQIQQIDGKISIKENRITFIPNYEPVFEGATVSLPDSAITLKNVKEGSIFDISNNVINSKEKIILNFFSLADNLKADIIDNYFEAEEVDGTLFALANLPYNFKGNTVVYKRNDKLNTGANNSIIKSELNYGAQHLEDNIFICDGDKSEKLIWLYVTAKDLKRLDSDTITVKNNTFNILKGGSVNTCIYYQTILDTPGKNFDFSGNILENAGKVKNLFLLYNSSHINYGNLTFIGNKGRVDDKLIGCTTASFQIVADSMIIQENDITLKADVLISPMNIPANVNINDIS